MITDAIKLAIFLGFFSGKYIESVAAIYPDIGNKLHTLTLNIILVPLTSTSKLMETTCKPEICPKIVCRSNRCHLLLDPSGCTCPRCVCRRPRPKCNLKCPLIHKCPPGSILYKPSGLCACKKCVCLQKPMVPNPPICDCPTCKCIDGHCLESTSFKDTSTEADAALISDIRSTQHIDGLEATERTTTCRPLYCPLINCASNTHLVQDPSGCSCPKCVCNLMPCGNFTCSPGTRCLFVCKPNCEPNLVCPPGSTLQGDSNSCECPKCIDEHIDIFTRHDPATETIKNW